VSIKRESLSKSFSTPKDTKPEPRDRAAGLAGLLPPRPQTSTPTQTSASTPKPDLTRVAVPVAKPLGEPRPAGGAAPQDDASIWGLVRAPEVDMVPNPSPATPVAPATQVEPEITAVRDVSGGGLTTIGVYLVPLTLERAREATLERRITYTDLLVEAFDHVTDTQLAAEFTPIAPLVQGKVMPTRVRRRRGTAGIQMNLRLSTEQRQWLDDKVLDLGAPSRSALVAEALRLHLNSAV